MQHQDRIKEIQLSRMAIPLKQPFVTSLGPHYHAENVVLHLRTEKGVTGIGECSPFMTINGESSDTCLIVGRYLAQALLGRNAIDIEDNHILMDSVIYGNTSIKSAFDIAMFDVASQHEGLPLYRFLKGRQKKITTDYTVSMGRASDMAAQAETIKNNGFTVIKVKLGGTAEEDVERIRSIRESIGIEIPLRIDANQGWNVASAIYLLNELKQYNIQFCEEPLPRWDYMNLPAVSAASAIPVMADESCCDDHDAQRLIGIKACGLFNIKTGKSSGIYKAMKIIRLAEKNGIYMQAGGFLESRIGFTATAHLSLSSDHIIFYDFDTPLMFTEDPVEGGIIYNKGAITVPDVPGLGATVSRLFLDKAEKILVR